MISKILTGTLIALSLASVMVSARASETDGFTHRYDLLADSSVMINARANKYMSKALTDLNASEIGCNEMSLYSELRKYFANHLRGVLVKEILNDDDIPKRPVVLAESVYRDWSPWDGLGVGLTFVSRAGITAAPILHFQNEYIGADKFEHFFGQGFDYFTSNYLMEKGAVKAIKGGIFREKIFLGGNKFGNGVFSYGDLSANFNGMRFWNHVLQKHKDVLGEEQNLGPYIQCENNKWIQVKKIDFTDYFDASMDESINCSKFPSAATVKKFKKTVADLGMNCPVEPEKLDALVVKYGKMSKWIINRDGNGIIHYFNEFKHKK